MVALTYIPGTNCWRSDLEITRKASRRGTAYYTVQAPDSAESVEFEEEEFFICQALDGIQTLPSIGERYQARFGQTIALEQVEALVTRVASLGFLEPYTEKIEPLETEELLDLDDGWVAPSAQPRETVRTKKFRWYWFNPSPLYGAFAEICRPLAWLWLFLVWCLVPGVPAALFLMFTNQPEIWSGLAYGYTPDTFLMSLLFHLLTINLISRIVQGTVLTAWGGVVSEFGMQLRFGVIPRFYIDRRGGRYLDREGQLWTVGSSLLTRLFIFVIGMLVWYITYGSGTKIGVIAVLLAYSGLFGFIVLATPIWGEGYRLVTLYFNLPVTMIQQAVQLFLLTIQGRPIPKYIPWSKRLGLLAYGTLVFGLWIGLVIAVITGMAGGLEASYPGLFGRGTGFLLLLLVGSLAVTWAWDKWRKTTDKKGYRAAQLEPTFWEKVGQWPLPVRGGLVLAGIALLVVPVPFRPTGYLQLVATEQRNIQSGATGQISQALLKGGDGTTIKAGTVLMNLATPELDNTVRTLEEQVKTQQAVLNKLLNSPRPEEVRMAEEKTKALQDQVAVNRENWSSAQAKARQSMATAQRYEQLYQSGTYTLALYEEARSQSDIDQAQVGVQANLLAAAQKTLAQQEANLRLVRQGPYPQDIEVARADLRRIQQELSYAQQQKQRTQIRMPFDGVVTTPYLNQKQGSFYNSGETYAVVSNPKGLVGEVMIPEYDAWNIKPGAKVELKLFSHDNTILKGQVQSVQPRAEATEAPAPVTPSPTTTTVMSTALATPTPPVTGNYVRVLVKLPSTDLTLKDGLSGYAKLDGGSQPLALALSRPILRFFQVNFWSALP